MCLSAVGNHKAGADSQVYDDDLQCSISVERVQAADYQSNTVMCVWHSAISRDFRDIFSLSYFAKRPEDNEKKYQITVDQ